MYMHPISLQKLQTRQLTLLLCITIMYRVVSFLWCLWCIICGFWAGRRPPLGSLEAERYVISNEMTEWLIYVKHTWHRRQKLYTYALIFCRLAKQHKRPKNYSYANVNRSTALCWSQNKLSNVQLMTEMGLCSNDVSTLRNGEYQFVLCKNVKLINFLSINQLRKLYSIHANTKYSAYTC